MCDRASKRRLFCFLDVNMNELVIVGCVRELVDAFLGYFQPVRRFEVSAREFGEFRNTDCFRHGLALILT